MKTKRKMLRIFLMLFGLFWLGGQKAFAQDKYERNITLTSNFTVGLDELYSYLALEYGKGINRVSVKNGETFMININSLANFKEITYLCAKNNISYDEQSNQIKITGAGSFDFRYTTQISGQTEQEWDVIIDVNYFGVLQYGAGDAPEKIAVVGKNDPRVGETIDGYVYLSEEATLSVPFNFPSTKWFGVDNGINNSLETIILNGTHSVSLETLKSTGYSEFAVRFRDGTSNELSSGLGGGESWDNFKLIAAPTQYTIQATAKPSHGGTVTGTGTFEEGSEVKLIATANEGFVFKNWTENEVEVSNEASYSFTATENRELVANFKLKELKISATADPEVGGTVSGNGTYNYGDKVALVATPANGYHFVSWMEGADVVSTNASYTFTATTERTFVAKFEKVVIAPKITTTSLPNTQQNQAYDYQLTATGTAPLTWKISSGNLPQGLNLSSDGKISGTPTQDGSFNFTVQVSNSAGNDTKQFSITVVKEVITVSGVTLDKDALKLVEGNTATLIATISPADATNQAVTWESSDTNIASVDSNGKVTAIKAGTATISVKTNDGGFTATCKVTVIAKVIKVSGVTLDKDALKLVEGNTATLIATISPANATNQAVTWESSDTNVATVDDNGKVTAIKAGTATISVKTNDGGFTATCEVTVTTKVIKVSGVSLDKDALKLVEGNTATLIATISPANATNQAVTWESSDTSIASVDSNGKVTAIKAGAATISVKTNDGGFTASCKVTVIAKVIKVSGVSLDKNALKLVEGNTATLIATISPANATNQAVTWESSDTNIASVDSNGKVTAIKAGTATISVKTNDGGLTASCKVTVIAPKPDTPTNLNISALYQREAEIAWDGGSASKWKVSYNNNDSIVTENKILLLGLIPGETCEATVQAISEQTESEAVKIAIPTHPLTTTEELVPHLWDEELPSGAEVRLIIKDCKSPIKTIKLTQGQTTSTIIGSYFTVGKEEIRIDLELEDGTVWELYYQTN